MAQGWAKERCRSPYSSKKRVAVFETRDYLRLSEAIFELAEIQESPPLSGARNWRQVNFGSQQE